ncbi:DNA topoisomerase IV subunit A [Haematospirillum jordaniae]|uniref:DNA topoisomerase 4 subunit A n=1 Tax=Haematospirillum jordaniae TaxID=1549855 RepID=A0A143DF24_9PROT|nr:DNA topoisomerase IV subunit A [Haematospirillum jordaniae]AMW35130.1 DNA topoisomerase IV subunit A [Haematospirillum jordaniae]NKD44109.1 DNA topoisomerase IV subunit A [Haematospirillum jordaniae]NKD56487.1 DNA topoisomerase IV subunit A [Haematospirillum jordaniae]NKD58545.1 DNA topoisomerase IV subunit A [Haematospirillum jordaniae]NKD66286.1 DNA topoisomerase IV subunit A [Haematospirillum jordaniae]
MSASKSAEIIRHQPLAEALSERYLAYALSTIVSRSLPDVRDGLKPVHRRLLYAMRLLKLDPAGGFKKCARVVGDVIGKYHPHGDGAVYDALVRLAQDFAARYPLVEGQGNFGNIDGDGAAAMRYTESRLTEVATALMDGLDEDAVDFRETYDGEESEPVVMPAAFPNVLANGSSGIAVGMATNIPPHNIGELCDALLALIKKPDLSVDGLLACIKGPDFPTGGILVDSPDSVHEAYATGRGTFRLRARWEIEKLSHGLFQIIVTEIPYQVQKSRVIEKIAELLNAKKLPLLADIRDESAEDVRVVLEPRNRTVDPELLMEHLFRQTDLEIRFSLNMNVLSADGTPRVMPLKDVLEAFLEHRIEVLERRSRYRLGKIDHRLEILAGYLIAYLNLDEVIRIIREEDEAKAALMKAFGLSDMQAEAILNMRLRSLRRLEEVEIRGEYDRLSSEKAGLESLLAEPSLRWAEISRQLIETKKRFGQKTRLGARKTEIAGPPSAVVVPIEAVIEREPVTLLLSEKGWIRALKGHAEDLTETRFKEGDQLWIALHAYTTDKILIFATTGRFYTLAADRIPRGRGFGEPLRLMVDLPNDAEVAALMVHEAGRELLLASSGGRGFRVAEDDIVAQTRAGKQVLVPGEGEIAAFCLPVDGDTVAIVGQNRKLLVFSIEEVPLMAKGRGVILQKYKDGGTSDVKVFRAEDGLTFRSGERIRTEMNLVPWRGARAGQGKLPPTGFPRSNRF